METDVRDPNIFLASDPLAPRNEQWPLSRMPGAFERPLARATPRHTPRPQALHCPLPRGHSQPPHATPPQTNPTPNNTRRPAIVANFQTRPPGGAGGGGSEAKNLNCVYLSLAIISGRFSTFHFFPREKIFLIWVSPPPPPGGHYPMGPVPALRPLPRQLKPPFCPRISLQWTPAKPRKCGSAHPHAPSGPTSH